MGTACDANVSRRNNRGLKWVCVGAELLDIFNYVLMNCGVAGPLRGGEASMKYLF